MVVLSTSKNSDFFWQAFAPRQLLLHCSTKLHDRHGGRKCNRAVGNNPCPCNDAKPAYMPSVVIAGFCSCKASIHAIHGNKRIFRGAEL
jgi:hypothetical protein